MPANAKDGQFDWWKRAGAGEEKYKPEDRCEGKQCNGFVSHV